MNFSFTTDRDSQAYCEQIVRFIMIMYGHLETEAIDFLNSSLADSDLREIRSSPQEILGYMTDRDLLFHELPDVWAAKLANPCPYGDRVEMAEWKLREDLAQSRIANFAHEKSTG